MELILASNSPRRKDLLQSKGIKFKVVASNYDEVHFLSDPIQTAIKFALGKASDVFESLQKNEDVVVLGADTVVYHNGEILGKAHSSEQARSMLKSLSGKTHLVITGYALISKNKIITGHSLSKVTFNDLSEEVVAQYIESGLYKGKAGSYGIQDGFSLVKKFTGDYNNIIGLPIEEIIEHLKSFEVIHE